MKTRTILTVMAAFTALGVWSPGEAHARKKGVLEGEPIVRKKLQLRKFRFQLTPFIGMSLSQPFVHMGYVGARVGTHFADWIGIRAGFGYGVIALDSKLLKAINNGGLPRGVAPGAVDMTLAGGQQCPADGPPCRGQGPIEDDNPAPLRHDFRAGVTKAQWQASVDAVFTPFSGKLGLFSAIFTEYDIYVFGGLGLVGWNKRYDEQSTAEQLGIDPDTCIQSDGTENDECILHPVKADTGVKIGGSFGAGLNLFLTDWVALNLEFQDIVTRNNIAGLNTTVTDIPPRVDKADKDVFHNVTFQLGATFYIPFKAKRTK